MREGVKKVVGVEFFFFFFVLLKFSLPNSRKKQKTHLILLGLTWMPQIRPGNMLRSTAT